MFSQYHKDCFRLNKPHPLELMIDTILPDTAADNVCNLFQFLACISHGYTDSCRGHHLVIIHTVAKSHCIFQIILIIPAHDFHTFALVDPPGNDFSVITGAAVCIRVYSISESVFQIFFCLFDGFQIPAGKAYLYAPWPGYFSYGNIVMPASISFCIRISSEFVLSGFAALSRASICGSV